jgi:methyl-accepting chemotaxis protein
MKDGAILASRTNLKGIITYANKAFIEISGFTKEELIGKNHNVVRHPDMPPEAFEDLWCTVQKGVPWVGIVKNRCKNGDFYWVKATVSPVIENGQVVEYMSVRTKPTRQQVEKAESLYRDINIGKASLKKGRAAKWVHKIRSAPIFWRLSISIISLLMLVSVSLIGGIFWNVLDIVKGNEVREMTKIHRSIVEGINTESRLASAMATLVAEMPDAKKAFSEGDRERLLELFRDSFVKLKKEFGATQMQFHNPPAVSFVRIHKPEKYGDDLSEVRKTIVASNKDKKIITGMEIGVFGLGIRGVVPIYQDKKHLGAVEFGMSFGQPFFDRFKQTHEVDLTLFLNKENGIENFASTLTKPIEIGAEDVNRILAGEVVTSDIDQNDLHLMVYMQAVQDFSGVNMGILQIVMDRSIFVNSLERLGGIALLIGGFALLIGFGVAFFISRSIARPIIQAADVAKCIADGEYDNDITIRRSDETGALLNSMLIMQSRLGYNLHEVKEEATINLRIKTALENVSSNVTLSDKFNHLIFLNKAGYQMFDMLADNVRKEGKKFKVEDLLGTKLSDFFNNKELTDIFSTQLKAPKKFRITAWERTLECVSSPVFDTDGEYEGRITQWTDITDELLVQQEIADIVLAAKSGDLTQRIDLQGKQDFLKQLGSGINDLIDGVDNVFADIASAMRNVADGNLTQPIERDYVGTFGDVRNSVNETINNLEKIVVELREAADVISTASTEISSGNNNLSARTEQQASSLEETASSMEELTSTVRNNADNAQQANQLAASARQTAEHGGGVVNNAIQSMEEINNSSSKIAEIIGVIDEIAFQTNLLALNASVEAARAGEQGRGFAVVATEVRNLAGRSATAAKEIKELIQDSVGKVKSGAELVNESGTTLSEIVTSVKKVGDIISEIAAASQEQSAGIDQVNQAVTSMDEVTQQNAALAEQTSAAAVSMSEKAREMHNMMNYFTVNQSDTQTTTVNDLASIENSAVKKVIEKKLTSNITKNAEVNEKATKVKQVKKQSDNGDEWEEF